ncbi:MAG TPA: hypothetical protein VMY78_15640 [Solirubrobacteraceae bacterium]|nr:hypothetical protein [Solirubrobacteraceae bacterium]
MAAFVPPGDAIGGCGPAIELGVAALAGPRSSVLRRSATVGSGFTTSDRGRAGDGLRQPVLQRLGRPVSLVRRVIANAGRDVARGARIIAAGAHVVACRACAITCGGRLVAFVTRVVARRARRVASGGGPVSFLTRLVPTPAGVVARSTGVIALPAGVISQVGGVVALVGGVVAPFSCVKSPIAGVVALRARSEIRSRQRIVVARRRSRDGSVALRILDLPTRGIHGTIAGRQARH